MRRPSSYFQMVTKLADSQYADMRVTISSIPTPTVLFWQLAKGQRQLLKMFTILLRSKITWWKNSNGCFDSTMAYVWKQQNCFQSAKLHWKNLYFWSSPFSIGIIGTLRLPVFKSYAQCLARPGTSKKSHLGRVVTVSISETDLIFPEHSKITHNVRKTTSLLTEYLATNETDIWMVLHFIK